MCFNKITDKFQKISTDFSLRKVIRKTESDGFNTFILSLLEHLTRNYYGSYLIEYILKYGIVKTISRDELKQYSRETVTVLNDNDNLLPFVSVIENGRFYPESGLILSEDFEIIEESVGGPLKPQRNILVALSRELFFSNYSTKKHFFEPDSVSAQEATITGPVVTLTSIYPNYFHWMAVAVHRLQYAQAYADRRNEKVTILISAEAPPFVEETLELLNCPSSSIKQINKPVHGIQEVLIPSHTDQHRDFDWLTDTILENARASELSGDRSHREQNNIYISRANAIERRVVNETEVIDMLSQYGFSSYRLEERTVAENARLFADADVIVGPHGAGLTDIIFSDDAAVIELFGYQSVEKKPAYQKLSNITGLDYEHMQCTPDSVDMIVDVDELEERVVNALNK